MSTGTKGPESVRTLLVSMTEGQLILPYSVVQEIITWKEPDPVEEGPDWMLGVIDWRRWKLPVISAERLSGGDWSPSSRKSHIVVCSLMNGDDEMPCVGIVAQGVPQLANADSETVVVPEDAPDIQWAVLQLMFKDAPAWVPNFDAIANALPRLQAT